MTSWTLCRLASSFFEKSGHYLADSAALEIAFGEGMSDRESAYCPLFCVLRRNAGDCISATLTRFLQECEDRRRFRIGEEFLGHAWLEEETGWGTDALPGLARISSGRTRRGCHRTMKRLRMVYSAYRGLDLTACGL